MQTMQIMQILIVVICGLLIGLAVFFFIRTIVRMFRGKCCEGCSGCSQRGNCSVEDEGTEQESHKEKDV